MKAAIYARQSQGKAKSITDQLAECRRDATACGYEVITEHQDGTSASRHGRRLRSGWPQVTAAVEAGGMDVLVLWEVSRGDRKLTTWSAFLDLLRERGVLLRVVNDDRTYDPSNATEWRTLAEAGVNAAAESDLMSKRIKRGVASAASSGRPSAGPCPYGYRRTFDPSTGLLAGQDIDPDTASIVADIIVRVGRGEAVSAITRDLNDRGVTPPGGGQQWYRQRVRELALSPVYAGRRVHRPGRGTGKEGTAVTYTAAWPAIVTDAQHYAAVRVLSEPSRSATVVRPGSQRHLLTHLARCWKCNENITARQHHYGCPRGCVLITRAKVDEYVQAHIVAYLSRDDIYTLLRQQSEVSDAAVIAAEDEVARLRQRLDEWRRSAIAGTTTPESFAVIEAGIAKDITAAQQRSRQAGIPTVLREILEPGADVAARWVDAPLAAKRAILAMFCDIRLCGSGQNSYAPIESRVTIAPRTAPSS